MEGDRFEDLDLSDSSFPATRTSTPSEHLITQQLQMQLFAMNEQGSHRPVESIYAQTQQRQTFQPGATVIRPLDRPSSTSSSGEYYSPDSSVSGIPRPIDSSLGPLADQEFPPRPPLQWAAEGLLDSTNDGSEILPIAERAVRTFWGQHYCTHLLFQGRSLPASGTLEKEATRKRRADSELQRSGSVKRRTIQNRLAQKAVREQKLKRKEQLQRMLLAERGRHDYFLPKAPDPQIIAYHTPEASAAFTNTVPDLYQKLPNETTIRTLCIEPSAGDDELSCFLVPTSLDTPTHSYEAVSYAWGDNSNRDQITCNGMPLEITTNLKDALRSFRLPDVPRYVWADAICINQSDVEERNHQVRLMRKIFMTAERVLVWLGNDPNGDAITAFSVLTGVVRGPQATTENEWSAHFYSNGISSNLIPILPDSEPPPVDSPYWLAVVKLFDIQWFWRLWCIQEVALAKSAILKWGNAEMSWSWVGHAAALIRTNDYQVLRKYRMPGVFNAYFMYRISQGDSDFTPLSMSFFHLMGLTRQFETSEPRDRIYGLLGIPTTDSNPERDVLFMQPDYSRDVEAIYWDLALKIFQQDSQLRLLSSVQHGPSLLEDDILPSWVPRWDKVYTHSLIPSDPAVSHNASRGMRINNRLRYNLDALSIAGVKISTVSRTYGPFSPSRDGSFVDIAPADGTPTFNWLSFVKTAEARKKLAWTLSAGKDWYGMFVANEAQHLSDFAAWMAPRLNPPSKNGDVLRAAKKGDAYRFAEAMSNACSGRRLFFTENGYMGLGPEAMEKGDVLVVLFGGTVPFVLRSFVPLIKQTNPRPDLKIDGYWKLVGDAYVFDLMDGQAIQMLMEEKLEARDFELK